MAPPWRGEKKKKFSGDIERWPVEAIKGSTLSYVVVKSVQAAGDGGVGGKKARLKRLERDLRCC